MFPTLYKIAMDFLPIQASAIPCERVFSSSGDTFTKKRNRLSPHLMEALQVVKFVLKKEQLHFTKGWAASQRDMEYNLMCAIGSASHEDLLASGSDLLTSAISGTTSGGRDYEALLRVIMEDECDDVPDDIATMSMLVS